MAVEQGRLKQALTVCCQRAVSLEHNSAERATKVLIEHRVDDWVHRGVRVAEPERHGERLVRDVHVREQRLHDVQQEERQPAEDEAAHDQSEDERRSFLLLPGQTAFFAFGVSRLGRFRLYRLLADRSDLGQVSLHLANLLAPEDRMEQPELDRVHHRAPRYHPAV